MKINHKHIIRLFLMALPCSLAGEANSGDTLEFTEDANEFFSQELALASSSGSGITERLEFSEDSKEFFSDELALPAVQQIQSLHPSLIPAKVAITSDFSESCGWVLTFHFPEPIAFTKESSENDLYLEFNQDIDSPDLQDVQEKLSYIIKTFSNGYNSIYLEGKKHLLFEAKSEGRILTVNILPDDEAPVVETKILKLAEARLLVEERNYHAALLALDALEEEYPEDKDVLVLRSTLEGLLPKWQNQVEILCRLFDEHPHDEDIQKLLFDAYTPHSPFTGFERQVQRTIGIGVVQLYKIRREDIIGTPSHGFVYGGVEYQLWRGHVSSIVNNQGNTVGFRSSRSQVHAYLRKEWASGKLTAFSIYAQEGVLGFGLQGAMLIPLLQGEFAFSVDWSKPYWGIYETLAYHGRENNIRMQLSSVYNRYLTWSFSIGTHRVGITGTPNGFSSVYTSNQVFLNCLVANPVVGMNYSLDAEYITQQKEKNGVNGEFNPVPYTSFENHSLRAYFIYTFWDRWYLTAYGGQTYNRLGTHAATFGGELKYIKPVPCGFELTLSAYRFPSTTSQNATAEYYTGSMTFRY